MTTRTTSKTVTFTKPFVLGHLSEVLPAGDYVVETDEELLQGISFTAYLKVLTLFHLNQVSENPQITRTVILAPHELDAALARDRESSDPTPVKGVDRRHQIQNTKTPPPSAERAANERAENEGMLSHVQQDD